MSSTQSSSTQSTQTERVNIWRLAWELARYRPFLFGLNAVLWTIIHGSPLLFGVLVGLVFDRLTESAPAGSSPWTVVMAFTLLAVGRNGVIWGGELAFINLWNDQALQLRRNLLGWLLQAKGTRVLPLSPGEAVSTFRDDIDDLLHYMENWVDFLGVASYGLGAVAIMAFINPWMTLVVVLPVIFTAFLTQSLSPQIRHRRRIMRQATQRVTGFIGEMLGAVQAVKLGRSEEPVLHEFEQLNEVRRKAALRDTFLTELLRSINSNMATIATALVLLMAVAQGENGITVGGLTVFFTFLPRLTGFMGFFGDILAQFRRTGVAYQRIKNLGVDIPDRVMLDRTRVPLSGRVPDLPPRHLSPEHRLQRVEVRNLSYTYPNFDQGITEIDFAINRGEFVVITGKIGSGKTTLLRSFLGLLPASGEIRWNGELLPDPATFLTPPRSAYTPQVPQLFSETLADNIALGERITREKLREAVQLAVLDHDLARLEKGVDTTVGARGVKLSGGQVQRSAAARMFATRAELLVFDDLSSALDVHTEAELWDRLFAQREVTCLVVSHRRAALQRADQLLLMDGGQVISRGTLEELLATSELMKELWESSNE